MKKILIIQTLIIALFSSAIINTANAQNDADPAVTSLSFAKSPLEVDEETTLITFITNGGFTTSVPAGSIGVQITLPSGAEYAAFPESTAALSGDYVGMFNWTYDVQTKSFTGISNQDILPGEGGMVVINIKGYIVVDTRTSSADILTLSPGSYPNDNPTNNNLTSTLEVTPGGTLPITLLSFNTVKQNNIVALNWQTSHETNSSYFEVQTSKNGTSWQTIGNLPATGNSSNTIRYSFTHNTPAKGINYYRLKLVDIHGRFEYSLTRSVSFSSNTTITVSPNPTADKVFITAGNDAAIQSILVYSSDGKLMTRVTSFTLSNSVDLSSFAPGIYLFKITDKENNTKIIRVIRK